MGGQCGVCTAQSWSLGGWTGAQEGLKPSVCTEQACVPGEELDFITETGLFNLISQNLKASQEGLQD